MNKSILHAASQQGAKVNYIPDIDPDISLLARGRNGLTMTSVVGDTVTIQPAYLYKPLSTSGYAYRTDTDNLLDIGASDFFFAMWVKNEDPAKTASAMLGGKYVVGAVSGAYGFARLTTSGYLRAQVKNTTSVYTIDSTTDFTANGPYFLYLDVNQTTHKFRFFINNVQVGSDLSCPGTFANLDAMYPFMIGAGLATANGVASQIVKSSHSDVYVGHFLPTPAERLSMYNREIDPTFEAKLQAHWPFMGGAQLICDCSGNGLHLKTQGYTGTVMDGLHSISNTRFGSFGSRYGLDIGFTVYQNGYEKIYVPLKYDGTEIIPTFDSTIVGYKRTKEGIHAGSLTEHNLANSTLLIPGTHWDRSNATIWGDLARDATTFYNSAAVQEWHTSELNNIYLQSIANAGYKGTGFVKLSDHSYKDRKVLNEILTYSVDKTAANYSAVVKDYCKDYVFVDTYENDYLQWKYENTAILYSRGLKVLKWTDAATDLLSLSIDGGLTYPYSINSPFPGEIPTFAHIFANGNILVAGVTKMYLSTNNLTSIAETTVLNVAGSAYSPTNYCFNEQFRHKNLTIGGVEMLIWSCYRVLVQGGDTDINIWYSVDNGVTVKSAYKAGVTNPPNLTARHIHAVNYNQVDGTFWATTGDNNTSYSAENNIIQGTYDSGANTWAWAKLFGDTDNNNRYKWTSIGFFDNSIVACDDDTVDNTHSGMWTCAIANLGTKSNVTNIFKTYVTSGAFICNLPELVYAMGEINNTNVLVSTLTGLTDIVASKLYGLENGIAAFNLLTEKNDNGWFMAKATYTAQSIAERYHTTLKSGTLWVKIKSLT